VSITSVFLFCQILAIFFFSFNQTLKNNKNKFLYQNNKNKFLYQNKNKFLYQNNKNKFLYQNIIFQNISYITYIYRVFYFGYYYFFLILFFLILFYHKNLKLIVLLHHLKINLKNKTKKKKFYMGQIHSENPTRF